MFVFTVFVLVFGYASANGIAPLILLNDGNKMPALALGTWLGNSSTGRIDPMGTEVETAVTWALQAGYRHIDTAWSYRVEDQVGRAVKKAVDEWKRQMLTTTPRVCDALCYLKRMEIKGHATGDEIPPIPREEIFITTKLWNTAHAQSAVIPALNASLKALQLDYVDLYLIHWPIGQFPNGSFDSTSYLDTWRGMMGARAQGLARSIGVSNFNKRMLEEIREKGLVMPAVLQIEWNLNLQQSELLAYCRQHNIVVMGYSPFGSLFPQKAAKNAPPPRVRSRALRDIAKKYSRTVPQVVLRYALQLGVLPIPKSLTRSRIKENIDVFEFELNDEDKRVLKGYDVGYRSVLQLKWRNHPHYPFEVPDNVTNEDNNPVDNNDTNVNSDDPVSNNDTIVNNNPDSNNGDTIVTNDSESNDDDTTVNNDPVSNNDTTVNNNSGDTIVNNDSDRNDDDTIINNNPESNNDTIVIVYNHPDSNNNSSIENSDSVRNNNPTTYNSTPRVHRLSRGTVKKLVTPKIAAMI